jgi:hypothetical protein
MDPFYHSNPSAMAEYMNLITYYPLNDVEEVGCY